VILDIFLVFLLDTVILYANRQEERLFYGSYIIEFLLQRGQKQGLPLLSLI